MANVKNITIKNIESLSKTFKEISNMELMETMNKATALVHGQAKDLAPSDNGDLAGSIHMKVKKKRTSVEGRIYTNKEYAPYAEFGTGMKGNGTYPYKIKGLNLVYQDKWYIPADKIDTKTAEKYHFQKVFGKDGAEYYLCYGQEAQPYMYPALNLHKKTIRQMFKDAVNLKLKQNSKGGK